MSSSDVIGSGSPGTPKICEQYISKMSGLGSLVTPNYIRSRV